MRHIRNLLAGLAAALVLAAMPLSAKAAPGCVGKMWNPLSDLDFKLMGGIKIAGFAMMKPPELLGEPPKHIAPGMCACKNGMQSGAGIGVTFWMPSYINDIARSAGCLGFLGGMNALPGFVSLSSGQGSTMHKARQDDIQNMQVHWAYADVTAIAGKALFEKCNAMTAGGMKISYLTEVDFLFQNDVYSVIMNPLGAIMAAVPMTSQFACGIESIANTLGDWRDFGVCAWKGGRFPLTANAIAKDSAQVSNMDVTIKYISRAALMGLTMRTMGEDVICRPKYSTFYDPFQHRYQWSFPSKVSTRYNVDMIRWGMFIKASGASNMMSLTSEASTMAGVDSTVEVGSAYTPPDPSTTMGPPRPGEVHSTKPPSANNLSMAESIVARIPKPLNFPSREAGYMQVWEARQCCMMVLTVDNALTMIMTNIATMGSGYVAQFAEFYGYYKDAQKIVMIFTDPVGAILGYAGDAIAKALDSVVGSVSSAASGILSGLTQ